MKRSFKEDVQRVFLCRREVEDGPPGRSSSKQTDFGTVLN
jgi:hypothetical protein